MRALDAARGIPAALARFLMLVAAWCLSGIYSLSIHWMGRLPRLSHAGSVVSIGFENLQQGDVTWDREQYHHFIVHARAPSGIK